MLEHPGNPEPDNDDEPVGHVLSRREIIKLIGAGGGLAAATIGGLQITNSCCPVWRSAWWRSQLRH